MSQDDRRHSEHKRIGSRKGSKNICSEIMKLVTEERHFAWKYHRLWWNLDFLVWPFNRWIERPLFLQEFTIHYTHKRIFVLDHPPDSPVLAPCDFYLFSNVKRALNGTHYQPVEDVIAETAEFFKRVSTDQL